MAKVAVVFWTQGGHTETMANAVAEGAKEKGADVSVLFCSDFNAGMVGDYDAIAFGCPAMGSEVLEEAEFQPLWDDCGSKLGGKKIALFGSYGWGVGEWMENWKESASDCGASLVNAVALQEDTIDDNIDQCKALGAALV
ncbi:MAG: flavodoxin [Eubacteriales bacterium]|nr:flavodoxin [Eubacteriales bacterium]